MEENRLHGVSHGMVAFVMAPRIAQWLRVVAEQRFREWADDVPPEELGAAVDELGMDKLRDGRAEEWAQEVNEKLAELGEPMCWFVVYAMLGGSTELRRVPVPVELARWLFGVAEGNVRAWQESVTIPEFQEGLNQMLAGMFGEVEVIEPIRWMLVQSAMSEAVERS